MTTVPPAIEMKTAQTAKQGATQLLDGAKTGLNKGVEGGKQIFNGVRDAVKTEGFGAYAKNFGASTLKNYKLPLGIAAAGITAYVATSAIRKRGHAERIESQRSRDSGKGLGA